MYAGVLRVLFCFLFFVVVVVTAVQRAVRMLSTEG